MTALEGSIREFGVADILQLIYFQKKTGVLTVTGKFDQVKIHFYKGNIVSATSTRRPEDKRLGNLLLRKNLVTEEALNTVLEEQKKTHDRIGSLLLLKGYIDRDALLQVLTQQIIDQVVQIFSWNEGTYVFRSTRADREPDITVDTQYVLMEGLRRVDEWSVIEGLVSPETVFKIKQDAPETPVTEIEQKVLQYINGENDVSTILDLAGETELEVLKAFVSLMQKGIIEPVEEAEEVITREAAVRNYYQWLATGIFAVVLLVLFSLTFVKAIDSLTALQHRLQASTAIEQIRLKIDSYRLTYGTLPETVEIRLKDPWGSKYIYRLNTEGYTVFSAGPDRTEGTEDDIY